MNMHSFLLYDEAADRIRRAIIMEREGKHAEGFITSIIEALEMLKNFAATIGKNMHERQTIDQLINEMRQKLSHGDEEREKQSSLAELLQ